MKVTAQIRRESDGVVRSMTLHYDQWEPGDVVNWWEDGNYSCDCNRGLFFGDIGPDEFDKSVDDEIPCSYGKYSVRLFIDGELVYAE